MIAARALGRSALEISPLGFGAWSMGGPAWRYEGPQERDAASISALLRAAEGRVNWVDTAPTYGAGHSEELVGAAIRKGAGRVMVFTKCGRRWDAPDARPYSDLRPESIRRDCEASLRRLRLDTIDMLQIHWAESPEQTRLEESWGEMRRLVDEGKARAAGVCNFTADQLARCEAVGHVDSLQTPISLIVRGATGGLLEWCSEHEVGVLAYSPMQVGLLTDTFSADSVATLDPADWRRRDPEFVSPRLERNLALRDALRPLAEAHATTVASVAVAWVLSRPGVTGAIVGASSAKQVDGWIGAANVTLSGEDLDQISAALRSSGAGSGPIPSLSA